MAICASSAPTAEERGELSARERTLSDALAPAEAKRIEVAVSALRGAFSAAQDEVSAGFAAALYARALQGFPLWAISEACGRFLENRTATPWKPAFCPTPPEMAAECRAILAPVYTERAVILKVLSAEVQRDPDPVAAEEARVAVAGAFERWSETIKPQIQNRATVEDTKRQAEEKLSEYARGMGQPIKVSPILASTLERMKAEI